MEEENKTETEPTGYWTEILFIVFLSSMYIVYRNWDSLLEHLRKYGIVIPETNALILRGIVSEIFTTNLCSTFLVATLTAGTWLLNSLKDYWFYRILLGLFCALVISNFHFLRYGTY